MTSKTLTSDDIMKALSYANLTPNLVLYSDMHKFRSIAELLGKDRMCVILYEKRPRYGHWTCIFEVNPRKIEFFDSYGIIMDDELDFISNEFREQNNMIYPYLSALVDKSHYPYIEYNNYRFQKRQHGINTCGRHVIVRLINHKLNLEKYKKFLDSFNCDYDDLVTDMTSNIK